MALYFAIDASNYTTSVAVYDGETGEIRQNKRLLPVKEGAVGQRQSDAVFGHVKALAGLAEELLAQEKVPISALGASVRPCDAPGSYMPCFLAGEMAARTAACALRVPLYTCSHQAGHIAAAAFGANRLDLLEGAFLAFHVSGGSTQCVRVAPEGGGVAAELVSGSLDLYAGQAVDRVGAMLGLPFPAGPHLERLAAQSQQDYRPKPAMKGADCCLSGVENQCAKLLKDGAQPCDVARYCLCFLRETLTAMTQAALERHPGLPLLYAGGVASNRFLQETISARFEACFAPPDYSADNAAGVALLAARRHERGGV